MKLRVDGDFTLNPGTVVAQGTDHGSFWWLTEEPAHDCVHLMVSPNNPAWVPREHEEYVWLYPDTAGIPCYIEYRTERREQSVWIRNLLRLSVHKIYVRDSENKRQRMYAIHKHWQITPVDVIGAKIQDFIAPERIVSVMTRIAVATCSAIAAGEVFTD